MDCRDRIQQTAEGEFPGCAVLFDEQVQEGEVFRFQIESANGRIISRAYPFFKAGDIDAKSDDEIRALIRQVCGR